MFPVSCRACRTETIRDTRAPEGAQLIVWASRNSCLNVNCERLTINLVCSKKGAGFCTHIQNVLRSTAVQISHPDGHLVLVIAKPSFNFGDPFSEYITSLLVKISRSALVQGKERDGLSGTFRLQPTCSTCEADVDVGFEQLSDCEHGCKLTAYEEQKRL